MKQKKIITIKNNSYENKKFLLEVLPACWCASQLFYIFLMCEDQMRNELKQRQQGTYTDADVKEVKKVDCMFVEMAETTQAAINNGDLNLNKASDMVAFFELSYKDGNKEETSKNFTSTTVVKISRSNQKQ